MISCFAIFSADHGSKWGNPILQLTGGKYSHAALGFADDECDPGYVYFESTFETNRKWLRSGVQGPNPWQDYLDWWEEDKDRRIVEVIPLPMTHVESYEALHRAKAMVGTSTYDYDQLLANAVWCRSSIRLHVGASRPTDVTCSEFVARLLPPAVIGRYITGQGMTFDDVMPDALNRPGLYSIVQTWIEEYLVTAEYPMDLPIPPMSRDAIKAARKE